MYALNRSLEHLEHLDKAFLRWPIDVLVIEIESLDK